MFDGPLSLQDAQQASTWSIGVTIYFLSLGLNGGSVSSMLNGHLAQSQEFATEAFEEAMAAGA